MFLHLLAGDPKWVPMAMALHESVSPGEQAWAVLGPATGTLPDGLRRLRHASEIAGLLGERSDWEGLVVHGMLANLQPALSALPDELPVAWVTWGWEAHQCWPPLKERLHGPDTQRALALRDLEAPLPKRLLRRWWRPRAARALAARTREVARRVDVCVVQLKEEYELFVRSGLLDERTQFCWASVGELSQFGGERARRATGKDIQLGNNASWTNNHFDAIAQLRELDLGDRRIVTPLTYGDERCREAVVRACREAFGERFVPLIDHLPVTEYEDLMQSCGVAWMAHHRQQAVGTILGALWRGATVYMAETTTYQAFTREGLALQSLDALKHEAPRLEPAPDDEAEANRRILERLLSPERVRRAVQDLQASLRRGRGPAA